jgi:DNA-directed RNA polymerase subunit F
MNNLIKKYALKINNEDIKVFCEKENINITDDEINTINKIIKSDIDNILISNDIPKYIEKYKPLFSDEVFTHILEYYNKYKTYIN